MATRQDTFAGRTVASGWGTASDGNTWTDQNGSSASESVSGGKGNINGSAASTFNTLGAALSADTNQAVRWSINDSSSTHGILARFADINNYYLCRYDGAGHIAFFKNVGGTKTTVTSVAFTPGVSNNFYWFRFIVQGSTIQIRHWADGASEPSTWDINTTDTGITAAGKVGLYGFNNFAANDTFDSYSAADIVTGTPINLTGTIPSGASLTGTLTVVSPTIHLSATLPSGAALSASLLIPRRLGGAVASGAGLSGILSAGNPGTGIGDITRSTGIQTANKSGNGYGTGDITGTEYDYAYTDSRGSGWAIGANPWYGGMPSSAWYQIDSGLNTTLPQKTSLTGNLMTLLTTQSGGQVHWEEDGAGGFQSSELLTFANAGNFVELAPTNTPFRAYLKAIGDSADANGISWTAWMCVYPGDPGLVVFRFDQHNGSGSAVSVDESDIEVIASLLTDTGTPAGAWNASRGFIGTIGGTVTNGWPADSVHQAGTFDYMGITPDPASGLSLGIGAAVLSDPSVDFGWTNGGYEAHISSSTTTPGRIKIGWYSDVSSNWTIPNGQTNTYYVLRAFRRNLTSADMAAIAADFKFPGTPTTTTGSFTSFSVDERAYQFSAAGNALDTTLDLSPAHVTVRWHPVLKITNWTAAAPKLTWGGAALTEGVDYRAYTDTPNQTLYLQLWFDVVMSGATSGQRNNAALSITDATVSLSGTLPSGSGLSSALSVTRPLVGSLSSSSALAGQLAVTRPLHGTVASGAALSGALSNGHKLHGAIPSGAGLTGTLTVQGATVRLSGTVPSSAGISGVPSVKRPLSGSLSSGFSLSGSLSVGSPTIHLQGSIPSSSGCSGSLSLSRPLQGSLLGQGSLAGTLSISLLHATIPSSAGCSGALTVGRKLAGGVASGAGCAGVLTIGQPTVHLTGAVPSLCGASGRLTIHRPLASTLLPGSGLGGSLKLTSNLTATILALTLSDRALASLLLSDDPLARLTLADVEGA